MPTARTAKGSVSVSLREARVGRIKGSPYRRSGRTSRIFSDPWGLQCAEGGAVLKRKAPLLAWYCTTLCSRAEPSCDQAVANPHSTVRSQTSAVLCAIASGPGCCRSVVAGIAIPRLIDCPELFRDGTIRRAHPQILKDYSGAHPPYPLPERAALSGLSPTATFLMAN